MQELEYHQSVCRDYIPAGLIEEIRALAMPPIPWDVELAKWFEQHFALLEPRRTYARPSRRQGSTPDIPRPRYIKADVPGNACTFGVVIDTSGSMSAKMLGIALGAIASYAAAREVLYARVVKCVVDGAELSYEPAGRIMGWYQGNVPFDFAKPVTESVITIKAKWQKLDDRVVSVKLNKTSLRLKKGQEYRLTAEILPEIAANKRLIWTTDDKKVATVSNGKVTAKGFGTATITAESADISGKRASCKIIVGYPVKYQLNGGKNNSKNPTTYYKENITLKNPTKEGYIFKGWFTDKKCKKKITKITKKNNGNLTLYAKWEKISVGQTAITALKKVNGKKASLKFKAVSNAAGYEITTVQMLNLRKIIQHLLQAKNL